MNLDLRKDVVKYETNPFVVELKGRMYLQPKANTIVAKGQEIIDTATGQVVRDSVLMGRRRVVDKSQFAKVYAEGVKLILDLSKPAVNVLAYIMTKMDFEQKVYLNTEKDSEKVGYKSALSVTKGLKELIQRGVIAPASMPSWYWVNPIYVCKGERFAVYTEFVTRERHEKDMEARRIAEHTLREQGVDFYNALDDSTQLQLQAMNERAERKHYEELQVGQGVDLFSGEIVEATSLDKD